MEKPGQPVERITMKSILEGILDVFNLEHGLIYTVVALTIRPGKAIRTYLYEDRTKLVKPFRFLLLTIALATFATVQYFKYSEAGAEFAAGFADGYRSQGGGAAGNPEDIKREAELIQHWSEIFTSYFNLFLLFGVPVLALATYWVFRRRMNYAEHLVANSYITGNMTLLYLLMMPCLLLIQYETMSLIYMVFLLVYSIFAYTRLYQEKWWTGALKTLLSTTIYLVLYYFLILVFVIAVAVFQLGGLQK